MTRGEAPSQPSDGEAGAEQSRLDAVRAKGREAQARLAVARGQHTSVEASFQLVERDRRLAASVLAGGIAFRLFFWGLPLALVLGGVLGFTSSESAEDVATEAGLTGAAADAVGDSVADASRGRWVLLVIGVSGLIWSGSRSVLALRRVYSLIWNVPPVRGGNPLKEAAAFSGVCLALLAIGPLAHELREISSGPGLVVVLLAVGAYFGIWLWVSTWLPHGDAPLRALIPGAVLFAVTAQLMQLFGLLPRGQARALVRPVRGLGLAATFLFALYIVGRLTVSSAILNAELWARQTASRESDANSPG